MKKGKFKPKKTTTNIEANLYEFNKANMKQVEPLDPEWFSNHCKEVAEEIFWNKNNKFPLYWMLLCREKNDYTIFVINNSDHEFGKALEETLKNRGDVIDFTKQPDNNYEIWIRNTETKENNAYYFFDYNIGVVEV